MKYLLATVTLYAIFFELSALLVEPVTPLLIFQSVLVITVTIVGTLACYKVNRRGDNQEFIDRYICIGWVVSIKIIALTAAAYFVYMVIGFAIGGEEFDRFLSATSVVNVVFISAISAVYYWRIAKHIGTVAN